MRCCPCWGGVGSLFSQGQGPVLSVLSDALGAVWLPDVVIVWSGVLRRQRRVIAPWPGNNMEDKSKSEEVEILKFVGWATFKLISPNKVLGRWIDELLHVRVCSAPSLRLELELLAFHSCQWSPRRYRKMPWFLWKELQIKLLWLRTRSKWPTKSNHGEWRHHHHCQSLESSLNIKNCVN